MIHENPANRTTGARRTVLSTFLVWKTWAPRVRGRRVGAQWWAQTWKTWGSEGGGAEGGLKGRGPKGRGQNFAFFFSSSDPLFVFFQFPRYFVELRWCLRVSIIENVVTTHIWALWASCEPPRGSEEEKKARNFGGPAEGGPNWGVFVGGSGVGGGLGVRGWGSGAWGPGFGSGSPGLGVENGPNTKH